VLANDQPIILACKASLGSCRRRLDNRVKNKLFPYEVHNVEFSLNTARANLTCNSSVFIATVEPPNAEYLTAAPTTGSER
jgi:hypothetical protein